MNHEDVEKGNIIIKQANVLDMPFEDETFDVITAFSTIFFWPNIVNCFKEVKRVLKTGGKFYMIQGLNGVYDESLMEEPRNEGCTFYDDEELKDLLLEAGFSKITAFIRQREENKKLVKITTLECCSEKIVVDVFDESIENEEEPISP